MGRNRKRKNQQLPKYVYINRGRYIYRPPGEKDAVLGRVSDLSIQDVWSEYQAITGESKATLQYIVDSYFKSEQFKQLKSRKEIERALNNMLNRPVAKNRTFGQTRYKSITPGIIRQYLDARNSTAGNRDIAYLSSAWSWCRERDIIMMDNPCKGVKKIREESRDRYITDSEYKAIYNAMSRDYYRTAMELAYLCRMRVSEALDAKVKDIKPEGLLTRRLKGSETTITNWTPRLQQIVDNGLEGCLRVPEMPIVNSKGSPVRYAAMRSAWVRACNKSGVENATFHDLKAKGISDFEGDKKTAGGHRDGRMTDIYDRKLKEIDATE